MLAVSAIWHNIAMGYNFQKCHYYILHWLQAMALIGSMIGGLPAGLVSDWWGRKVSVAVSGIVFAAGYAVIAFAKVPNINPQSFKGLLMLGRLITGIASGWTFVSTSVS